ncbi:hypothetical protein [Pseudomonas putida]|uniref:hypothetical protein n=1 Tax=Pseudomonas putida TaxID=303 RepID=UPI002116B2E6|nr:hypothetical protein [Pseudomonas putida]
MHHRTYDEIQDNGISINVQVRLSRTGNTQLFIGVYAADGHILHEEMFDSRPGESMSKALANGVLEARQWQTDRTASDGIKQSLN